MSKKKHKEKNISTQATTRASATFVLSPFVVLAIFLVVAIVLYANSLKSPFIWDDDYLITDNYFVKNIKYIGQFFTHHLYYSTAGASNFYRPLQTLLLLIDYHIWKENVIGYHITNVIFHVVCALLGYVLIALLTKRKTIAFMASLLFLVHPVNSTVVNYISSRADSQATLFILLAAFLFLKSDSGRYRSAYLSGALISFILGLFSKELAVILPFFLLIIIPFGETTDRAYKKTVPFFALLVLYITLRLTVLNWSVKSAGAPPALFIRLLTTAESFVRLMGLMIAPRHIHIEKRLDYSAGLFDPATVTALLILAVLAVLVYAARRRCRYCLLGYLWFFLTLIPMANIVPINATIADHWLYLPCFGFFLCLIGLATLPQQALSAPLQQRYRKVGLAVYWLIIIICALLTVRQNAMWQEPLHFYRTALVHNPQSFRAHNEIGVIYMNEHKDYDRAVREFSQAIATNPHFDQAYDNLGVALDHKGNLSEAVVQHQKALAINPYNAKTYNNMGNAYNKMGRFDKAIAAYQKALELNPDYRAAYNNIGAAYYKLGDYKRARWAWSKALQIDPNFTVARENLKVLDNIEQQGGNEK